MRTTEGTTVTGATTEVASVVAGSAAQLKELQGERVFQGVRDLGCEGSAAPLTSARDRRGASERGETGDLILRNHAAGSDERPPSPETGGLATGSAGRAVREL